ncbi:MAG: C-GCAxxG-C-C family protein [Thermoleophilia bacterium]|nr:C-GCAxxG-C-C family protein [Thermoleophilia bacterium]
MDGLEQARDAALAGFREQGPDHLNCAQAVVLFTARAFEQDGRVVELANYMGGGAVGMGQLCGALAGAVLALGVRDYLSPQAGHNELPANKQTLQQLIGDFERDFGNATCRGLTGYDISTKDGYASFKADEISSRCADYVAWVCDRLAGAM